MDTKHQIPEFVTEVSAATLRGIPEVVIDVEAKALQDAIDLSLAYSQNEEREREELRRVIQASKRERLLDIARRFHQEAAQIEKLSREDGFGAYPITSHLYDAIRAIEEQCAKIRL